MLTTSWWWALVTDTVVVRRMSAAWEATRMKTHKKNQPLLPRIGDGVPKHVPLSGWAPTVVVRDGVTLLQLNVEGLTKAKINVLLASRRLMQWLPYSCKRPTTKTDPISRSRDIPSQPAPKAKCTTLQPLWNTMPSGAQMQCVLGTHC